MSDIARTDCPTLNCAGTPKRIMYRMWLCDVCREYFDPKIDGRNVVTAEEAAAAAENQEQPTQRGRHGTDTYSAELASAVAGRPGRPLLGG